MQRRIRTEKKKKQRGSIAVETLMFLIPFVLAFGTFINVARFIEAEMIIHHAITQTAKEISTYSHILTKADISKRMKETQQKNKEYQSEVGEAAASIRQFYETFSNGDSMSESPPSLEEVEEVANDVRTVASFFITTIKTEVATSATSSIAGALARGSIKKQLSLMTDNPDEHLEKLGIVGGMEGLDFSKSEWNSDFSNPCERGNVEVVVTFRMRNNLFPMFDFGEHEYILSVSTWTW